MNAMMMWNVPIPGSWGPPDKVILFDDFVSSSAVATDEVGLWDIGTTAANVDAQNILGGAIQLDAQAAEETFMRTNGAAFAMPSRGKTLYWEARIRPGDADDAALLMGLGTPGDATPIAGITDFIGFTKVVDVVTLSSLATVGGVAVATDTNYDAADATWFRVAFFVDANGRCTFYVNGAKVGETTVLPAAGTVLQPLFAISLDAGTADNMDIDYVLVMQDRE